jgi:hypothetical protein
MATTIPVEPKMPRPKRNDEPTKLDKDVLREARTVCAHRNIMLAQYLSELLRPLVHEDYLATGIEITEQKNPADGAGPRRRK